jgi:DNA/RNA endonuclease G (NUC1)
VYPSRNVLNRKLATCLAIFSLLAAFLFVPEGLIPPAYALTNNGSINALESPVGENFETLASTGTNVAWSDNATIPGWYSSRAAYNAGTGSSGTGALYSFGVAGVNAAADRSLGSIGSASGTGTVYWAVKLTNNTGSTITSVDVSYVGEQWRNGGSSSATPGVAQTAEFQYRVATAGSITGANSPVTVWTDFDPLDFTSPVFGTVATATLDGNSPANRVAKASPISAVINPGQELWLRWVDIDHPNNDHGLAVDDLTLVAHGGPASTPTPSPTPSPAPSPSPQPSPSPTATATATATPSPTPSPNPTPVAGTNILINEVDSDTPGTDAAEFIELYDGGLGNTSLNGLTVVLYNGSNDTSYAAFDLDGYSTNAAGYFTLGNPAVSGVDLTFNPGASGFLQNGVDAVALYAANGSNFPNGTPVTTSNLIDALVYDTGDADDAGLLVLLNPGQAQVNEAAGTGGAQPNSNQRCLDGSGGARNTSTYTQGSPSPDSGNVCTPPTPTQTPTPSPTPTPAGEAAPAVLFTSPSNNNTVAPRDGSVVVGFTEPVNVAGQWFRIECASTGVHNSGTVAGGPSTYTITPNVNFINGEQCSVAIEADLVTDQDTDDAPGTDNMAADYGWSFSTSTFTAPVTGPPYQPDVHLTMGNPSGAIADAGQPNNYLMVKPEYSLSYNRDRGTPNWVSWHLSDEWVGSLPRDDTFRPDPAVLPEWYRVLGTDYTGSGFDRGHMVPNADRDQQNSRPVNQATFLMSNIIPQAPDNNQGPWAAMENDLRSIAGSTNELYIVAGGHGTGGTGSAGAATTIVNGRVTVPAQTWKVVLVLPKAGGDDTSRVTCATRTIAVILPNTQGIRNTNWNQYITTVDAVEALTGYDFYSNLPDPVERCVEAGTNGNNTALDTDADGVPDATDNCDSNPNPNQSDFDNDGQGDACDTDDDNDGVPDADEAAAGSDPFNAASKPEVCDGVDNDLNDGVDEGFPNTDGDALANCVDPDDDNDGQADVDEAACGSNPLDAGSKAADTDNDGRPDCVDSDDDGDGVSDGADNCPLTINPNQANYDGDAQGDVCDADDDNDGVADASDAFPFDPSESVDTDGDGVGNNADTDDDNDGQTDADEIACGSSLTNSASKSPNNDGDARPDCVDPDDDNDGVADVNDRFPFDAAESVDTDDDGIGNNADTDDDNDGVSDATETAAGSDPLNASSRPEVCDGVDNDLNEGVDEGFVNTDGDAQANCVDNDDDNDGAVDGQDAFPLDPNESVDTDRDGVGNNADPDDDNDGVADTTEISAGSDPLNGASKPEVCDGIDNDLNEGVDEGFPNTDLDSQANCVDADDDNDGVPDTNDAFPLDANESLDTDADGIGNNADPDDDNDGQTDADEIACGSNPLAAGSKSVDTDGDSRPDCVDSDDDNDGVPDNVDNCPLIPNPDQADFDGDGRGDTCDNPAPTSKGQCTNGGWQLWVPRFKNQGDCIQFVNTGH